MREPSFEMLVLDDRMVELLSGRFDPRHLRKQGGKKLSEYAVDLALEGRIDARRAFAELEIIEGN